MKKIERNRDVASNLNDGLDLGNSLFDLIIVPISRKIDTFMERFDSDLQKHRLEWQGYEIVRNLREALADCPFDPFDVLDSVKKHPKYKQLPSLQRGLASLRKDILQQLNITFDTEAAATITEFSGDESQGGKTDDFVSELVA